MKALFVALVLVACGSGGREGAGAAPFARGTSIFPAGTPGTKVSLVVNDKQVDVGLDEVPQASGRVRLRDLWQTGMPTEDPMLLHFDLVDHRGFQLRTRPACRQLLNGSDFSAAWMDVATHDVGYDPSLSINDCYRMRGVVRIEARR